MSGLGEAFDEIWTKDGQRHPGHLALLRPSDCEREIGILRRALARTDSRETILAMLADRNWRPNLVAATAVLLHEDDGRFAAELWRAVDDGSWVSPQLAVVLSLHDPEFVGHALDRARRGCRMTGARWGANAEGKPNGKTLLALLALLEDRAADEVRRLRSDPEIAAVLREARDPGDQIAVAWRSGMLDVARAPRR